MDESQRRRRHALPGEHGTHADIAWRLSLFDNWSLRRHGEGVDPGRRAQRLLALIALQGPHSRLVVAGNLWPDSTESRALGNLRATVWRLRHDQPDLLAGGPRDPLMLSPDVQVDVVEFRGLVRHHEDPGTWDLPTLTAVTRTVLDADELLPGWYDDWVLLERERLQRWRRHGLESFSRHLALRGSHALALTAAEAAVDIEPLSEKAQRNLIQVQLAAGNQVDALRSFEAFRRRSLRELGIGPSQHTEALLS